MTQKGQTDIVKLLDKDGKPFLSIEKISPGRVIMKKEGSAVVTESADKVSAIRNMNPSLFKLFQ